MIVEGAITVESKIDPVNIDQDGASDTNILTWESDTSRWQPAAAAGGSSKEYANFYLNTAGASNFGDTDTTLHFNTTAVNSDSGIFVMANNQVTVNKTAVFAITADAVLTSTSGSAHTVARSEYTMWIEKDDSEIVGSKSIVYVRGTSSGSTGSITIIDSVTSGEVFQIMAVRTGGTENLTSQDAWGTRINFKEI